MLGITSPATYDTVPLVVDVGVLSSQGRRYLELLAKLDQVMLLLQTLEIHEVVTTHAVDIERAGLKRKVRDVANGGRSLATRMRRAMNALDAQRTNGADGETDEGATAPSESSPIEESDRTHVGGVELAGAGREVGMSPIDAETGGATSVPHRHEGIELAVGLCRHMLRPKSRALSWARKWFDLRRAGAKVS